jgi:hypothetical protein
MTAAQILALARAYAAATNLALTSVGKLAVGNDKIFVRLANGSGANVLSVERAAEWFNANWPDDTPWPADVPRPQAIAA